MMLREIHPTSESEKGVENMLFGDGPSDSYARHMARYGPQKCNERCHASPSRPAKHPAKQTQSKPSTPSLFRPAVRHPSPNRAYGDLHSSSWPRSSSSLLTGKSK